MYIDSDLRGDGASIQLWQGLASSHRSDPAGVWSGIIDSLRLNLTSVLVDDFESGSNRVRFPDSAADPPDKSLRVFYIRPTDVPLNPKMVPGITSAMQDAQKFYLEKCKFTFKLNDPVVEVVNGTHPRSWYEDNPGGGSDDYWRAVYNAKADLSNRVPSVGADGNRKRWKIVFYVDAEGTGAGGGEGGGWVLLPKHDADGASGYSVDKARRWVGGMCHELGHCFGLPDAKSNDGTIMSAAMYNWPNCTIMPAMVTTFQNLGANSGFWFPTIATGIDLRIPALSASDSWSPRFSGNELQVGMPLLEPVLATISLYDLAGKRRMRLTPGAQDMGKKGLSFPVGGLEAGSYVFSVEEGGKIKGKRVVRKAE